MDDKTLQWQGMCENKNDSETCTERYKADTL
jgi:hypothetical protein